MAESDNPDLEGEIADAMQSDYSLSSSSSFEILPSENDNGLESSSQTKQCLKFNNSKFHLDINDNSWIMNISGIPSDLPFKSDQKVSLEILNDNDLCLNVDGDLFSFSGSREGKAVVTPFSNIAYTSPLTHIETISESCKCKKGEVQSHTVLSNEATNKVGNERRTSYDFAGNETKKDSNNENQKIDVHNKDERWTSNVEGGKRLGTEQTPSQISDDEKHTISGKRHHDVNTNVSKTAGLKPVKVDSVGKATQIRYKNSSQESEMDQNSADKQSIQGSHTVTPYGYLELMRRGRLWILIVGSNENILSGIDAEDDVSLLTDEDDVYIKAGDVLYDVSIDTSSKATLTLIPEATIVCQPVPYETAAEVQNTLGSEAAKNDPSTTDSNNVLDHENKYWTINDDNAVNKELKSDERMSLPSSVEKSKHRHEQHLKILKRSKSVPDFVSDLTDSFGKMTIVDKLPVAVEKKDVKNDGSKTINSLNDDRKYSIDASANQKAGVAMVCDGSKTQASSTGARTEIQFSTSCIGRFHTTDSEKEKKNTKITTEEKRITYGTGPRPKETVGFSNYDKEEAFPNIEKSAKDLTSGSMNSVGDVLMNTEHDRDLYRNASQSLREGGAIPKQMHMKKYIYTDSREPARQIDEINFGDENTPRKKGVHPEAMVKGNGQRQGPRMDGQSFLEKLGMGKSEPKKATSPTGDESHFTDEQVSIMSIGVRIDHDRTFSFLSHSKIMIELAEKNRVQIDTKQFDDYQGFEISGDHRSVIAAENMLKDILRLIVTELLHFNVGKASCEKVSEILSQLKSKAREKYDVFVNFDIHKEKPFKNNDKTDYQSGVDSYGKSEDAILKIEAPKEVSWLFPSGYKIVLCNSQIENSRAACIIKFTHWNGKERQIASSQLPFGFGSYVTQVFVGLPVCTNADDQMEPLKELLTRVLQKAGEDQKSIIAFDLKNIQTWGCLNFLQCLLLAVWSHFKSQVTDKPAFVELWNAKADEYQAANFHCHRLITSVMGKEIDCLSDDPLKIIVVEGSLDRTKAEVLVNTTSPDLQLNQGAVSVALLKAAGNRLQDECSKRYPRGINWGEIAVTQGYGLQCTFVFHGALPPYKANITEAEKFQAFEKFMDHCLTRASDFGCRSIAFPVLGAGNLKYPVHMVAAEMFICVEKFQQSYKRSTLRMVYFVVYQTDREVLKIFRQMQSDLDAQNRKGIDQQQKPGLFASEASETDEGLGSAIEYVDVELTGLQNDMNEAKCFVATRLRRDTTDHKHIFIMHLPTSLRQSVIFGDGDMQDRLKQKLKNLSADIISTDSSFLLQAESFESLKHMYLILKESTTIDGRRQSLPVEFQESSVDIKIYGVTKTDFMALEKMYQSTLDKYIKNGNTIQYGSSFVLIQGKGGDIEFFRNEIEKLIAYIKKLEKCCIDIPEVGSEIVDSIVAEKEARSDGSCIILDREQSQLTLYGREKQPLLDFKVAISDKIKNVTDKQDKNSCIQNNQNHFSRSQNPSETTSSHSQDTFIFRHNSGSIKVIVRKGDLLRMPVDCIVNAANEYLSHNAGVAAAVAAAAGPQFQKDSDSHVKRHGKVSSGDIVVAPPGKLPYRCVIHGVGPNWRDFQPLTKTKFRKCKADIQSVILKALNTVNNYKWKSVAIPAISAGYLGVPGDVCALQYVEAVKHFSSEVYSRGCFVEEIYFLSLDRDLVKLIQHAFTTLVIDKKVINLDLKYLPHEQTVRGQFTDQDVSKVKNHSPHAIQNVKDGDSGQNVPSLDIRNRIKIKEAKQGIKILPEPTICQSPSKATVIKFTSDQELRLYAANILEIKLVDAVVVCDDLSGTGKGNIATGLRTKAGPKYISEKQNAFRSRPSFGDVIVTSGGDSQFKYVFHALLHHRQHFPQNIGKWYDAFRKMLICIFNKAINCSCHTIAMPVIGADTRMQDISEYARVLLGSYKSFCMDKPTADLAIHLITKEPSVYATLQTLFEHYITEEKQQKSSHFSTTDTSTNQVLKSDRETEQQRGNITNAGHDCVICLDTVKLPKKLACGHTFCQDCIDEHLKTKNSCPVCGKILGKITGNQPHGNMKYDVVTMSLPGYEKCKTIRIEYTFTDGIQRAEHPQPGMRYTGIRRVAFLPDNEEGQQVLKLLRVAFERRLTFTIGQSRTTGRSGVITWNDIHHKTDVHPNAQFGYPDPTYFDRVKDELAAKGVTLDDIK